MLLLIVLVKFELVFATIMSIEKHMVMRLDHEISSAIFYYDLTAYCGLIVYVKTYCAPYSPKYF